MEAIQSNHTKFLARVRDKLLKNRTGESMGYVDGVLDFYLELKKGLDEDGESR